MRKVVSHVGRLMQLMLLWSSYSVCYMLKNWLAPRKKWAVGTDEVAANVHNISSALGNTISVNMSPHPFYTYTYDHCLPARISWPFHRSLVRLFYSPILLGYLSHRVEGFIYVAGQGFMSNKLDGRSFEFHFLKSRGLKIVCFFCGSEIRSTRLMNKLSSDMERDLITTYLTNVSPGIDSDHKEAHRMSLARSAEKYADHIFNAPVDQISYFRRDVHPFLYFYPESGFRRNDNKFAKIDRVKLLHGPSSPIIKGTPLVRAAIKKLKIEGYDFEYRELIGVSNHVMLEALIDAHVVLNQFYSFVPGYFGVEAMSSHCALMTSADNRIETTLPDGANDAWMVTEYWNIYDNLKRLLDDHSLIKQYADAGYRWAREHCSYEKSAIRLKALLETSS